MGSDPDCIFCKIVAKQIPAAVVFEDESLIAILDVNPLAEGHLLVIPREHYEQIVDMPEETWAHVAASIPQLGRAVLSVSGAEGFNLLQNNGRVAGQAVNHVHFHLIPRRADDGLGYRWNAGSYSPGRDAEFVEAYKAALEENA